MEKKGIKSFTYEASAKCIENQYVFSKRFHKYVALNKFFLVHIA